MHNLVIVSVRERVEAKARRLRVGGEVPAFICVLKFAQMGGWENNNRIFQHGGLCMDVFDLYLGKRKSKENQNRVHFGKRFPKN